MPFPLGTRTLIALVQCLGKYHAMLQIPDAKLSISSIDSINSSILAPGDHCMCTYTGIMEHGCMCELANISQKLAAPIA